MITLPSYEGHPVLINEPNWVAPSPNTEFRQTKQRWDAGPGKVKDDAPYTPRPRTATTLHFDVGSRAEMLDLQSLLRDVLIGSLNTIWVPTWTDDVKLVAGTAADERDLFITPIGYNRYYAGTGLGRNHVVLFPSGSGRDAKLFRRIVANSIQDDGTEKLTLDSDLGVPLVVGDMVCFLLLCRADDDALDIRWESWDGGSLELPLIDVPREAA